ncbi:MAG TPA: pantoate--beta-alanine ligase, partial [Mycobacteriales bacterium]|nr:pantoate--beta-alanine ligase [Mycobacteriales bacterium]
MVRTRADLSQVCGRSGGLGVVMTMGALHEGHAANIRAARACCGTVVVTVFVNPTQFGPGEDLDRYPRTLDADLELCAAEGVDVVFAPPVAEVYRGPAQVTVHPGPLGAELEGASRPGHFAAVLTVVHKMLHIVPDARHAFFGEKDYQQLTVIRRMVHDLDLDCRIHPVPTVREPDGLARSSRNRYLSGPERRAAAALPTGLRAGVAAGPSGPAAVLAAAGAVLDSEPGVDTDYLVLRGPDLGPAPGSGPARLLVAARVGATRLIDNMPVT